MSRRTALIGLAALLAGRAALALWHYRHFGGFPYFLSSAEYLRAILSLEWARSPRFDVDAMWLPGSFWVYGTALRLWAHPLLVLPLVNTAFTLGTLCCLFFLTELLTGSAALGLWTAAYVAFQAESLILGTGAAADPLFQLTAIAGVYCWVRSMKGGRFLWMPAACALIAAGSLVRYEAWLLAAGLAGFWIRDWPAQRGWARRLAPLMILALPIFGWLIVSAAHGEAFGFLKNALQAHDEDFRRMTFFQRFVAGLGDLGAPPLLWLGRLLPAAAWSAAFLRMDGDRAWKRVVLLGLWFAGGFMLLGLFVEIHVDLHPWFMLFLASPFIPWFVRRTLSSLARAPRRAALAVLVAAVLSSDRAVWSRLTRLRPLKAAALEAGEAVRDCLGDEPGANVLIEAYPRETRPAPEHTIQQGWAIEFGLDRVLLDRACDVAVPDVCSEQKPRTSSVLDLPGRRLSSWLVEHKVALIVTSDGGPSAAADYEPVRLGGYDALVAPGRPELRRCLAARSF